MNTPEDTSQVEYFGPEATAKNTELVAGKAVTLIKDVSETDQYGRLLRYVIVDDLFVNYELVSLGYANTASYPPDTACIPAFQAAEQRPLPPDLDYGPGHLLWCLLGTHFGCYRTNAGSSRWKCGLRLQRPRS